MKNFSKLKEIQEINFIIDSFDNLIISDYFDNSLKFFESDGIIQNLVQKEIPNQFHFPTGISLK